MIERSADGQKRPQIRSDSGFQRLFYNCKKFYPSSRLLPEELQHCQEWKLQLPKEYHMTVMGWSPMGEENSNIGRYI